eukprot:4468210-Pyramimonas_sp.AAC.1
MASSSARAAHSQERPDRIAGEMLKDEAGRVRLAEHRLCMAARGEAQEGGAGQDVPAGAAEGSRKGRGRSRASAGSSCASSGSS